MLKKRTVRKSGFTHNAMIMYTALLTSKVKIRRFRFFLVILLMRCQLSSELGMFLILGLITVSGLMKSTKSSTEITQSPIPQMITIITHCEFWTVQSPLFKIPICSKPLIGNHKQQALKTLIMVIIERII